MDAVRPDTLLRRLEWRYAVKKFDAAARIPDEAWRTLEQALVLTPSSYGLQPWRFVVVDDAARRAELVAASWNQRQVVDASHLVVFAVERVGPDQVERYLRRIADVRGVASASLEGFRKMLLRFVAQPAETFDLADWAARQAYIALGNFMTSAALLGIDTCPMEGIEPARYDEILGLRPTGFTTCVVCCAGYRAADDPAAAQKKVRYAHGEVVLHV